MLRTLTGIGFALALVGSAHAQDSQITIKLGGKSHSAIRAEIYQAAEKVCTSDPTLDPFDTTCVEESYLEAMQQVRAASRVERTVYVQPSPTSLH